MICALLIVAAIIMDSMAAVLLIGAGASATASSDSRCLATIMGFALLTVSLVLAAIGGSLT